MVLWWFSIFRPDLTSWRLNSSAKFDTLTHQLKNSVLQKSIRFKIWLRYCSDDLEWPQSDLKYESGSKFITPVVGMPQKTPIPWLSYRFTVQFSVRRSQRTDPYRSWNSCYDIFFESDWIDLIIDMIFFDV